LPLDLQPFFAADADREASGALEELIAEHAARDDQRANDH
jgi:hypothetical protein